MYYLKLMELAENKIYNGVDCIDTLVHYIMCFSKVSDEKLRVKTTYVICAGFRPCPFPEIDSDNPNTAISIIEKNTRYWGKGFDDVLRHRIISFDANEYVLPPDLDRLANDLIDYYAKQGFIACYGVHRDTYQYHIHVAVNTRSFQNGRKMNIYYETEKLRRIVNQWDCCYMQPKLENPQILDYYKNAIFGEDCVPQYKTAIGAVEQIKVYKEIRPH